MVRASAEDQTILKDWLPKRAKSLGYNSIANAHQTRLPRPLVSEGRRVFAFLGGDG
jgi:hypothetical protein